MKIGQQPLDEATRKTLEQAYPEVTFDWVALTRTLQQALATPRAPMTPESRRRSAAGRGGEGRPSSGGPGGGGGQREGGRPQQGPGRVPPASRPQMPPRQQRPPYAAGFGDQGEQERRAHHRVDDPRTLDDTADLPFRGAEVLEPDTTDTADLVIQPYDEPILEEGLETLARRGAADPGDIPSGPDEIEVVEERTFVVSVSSGDDDSGEHALVMDEAVEPEPERLDAGDDRERFDRATFERPELPGAGFTLDEFPVAADVRAETVTPGPGPGPGAASDPSAAPRRRRRRRRGGRRSHGGPNAASQPGGGPSSEAANEPDFADAGPEDHDDDSDV
jgi:hypothetical protein